MYNYSILKKITFSKRIRDKAEKWLACVKHEAIWGSFSSAQHGYAEGYQTAERDLIETLNKIAILLEDENGSKINEAYRLTMTTLKKLKD